MVPVVFSVFSDQHGFKIFRAGDQFGWVDWDFDYLADFDYNISITVLDYIFDILVKLGLASTDDRRTIGSFEDIDLFL